MHFLSFVCHGLVSSMVSLNNYPFQLQEWILALSCLLTQPSIHPSIHPSMWNNSTPTGLNLVCIGDVY